MSVHQLLLQCTLPSAPSTTRAIPTRISAHGSVIAYGTGNNVVVRDMAKPGHVTVCRCHTAPVTAVRISPSGKLVASGDQNGNLLVWVRQPDTKEVLNTKQLQGPVRDIAWTADEERLAVVGDGKNIFASAITITANSIGTINGHSQNILSCDMRGDRPYRIVTGGADSMVGFYEGVPFKFKCNVKGHTDKVTCVRYSPDMERIATVSRSTDIIILDGTTAENKKLIPTGHKGTIFAIAWSQDGGKIATASADKTVKIFDAEKGTLIGSCSLGTEVGDMQQGVAYTSQGVLSVSFGGKLTLISEQGEKKTAMSGHQGRIILLHNVSDRTLVSVSVDRALVWCGSGDGARTAQEVPIGSDVINAAAFGEGNLYLAVGSDLLRYALTDTKPTLISKEAANTAALAVTTGGNVVLLSKNGFIVVDALGHKVAEEKLNKFDGTSAAAHSSAVLLGGDKVVKGYRVTAGGLPEAYVQFAGHHTGVVACVAFSSDGQRVASGDAARNIFVWSATDGSVLYKDLVFHTLRVTALAFSPKNNAHLLSGSMDAALILWDLNATTRKTEDGAHRGGVSAVAWAEDGVLLSGGSDACVRCWKPPSRRGS
ncbi:WD40 repeat-containing protein [Trypanosoma grayi]|uniref:WD40 repeat-containing protein n=1 Tax=Trypanosoma grayi TaxID=71804 RepID=UPI0004F4809D|nr:WD40 repeat-containing protein [Trypanosoma grayi]KEG13942.1 WD40 repeat-containing protein [Trypanosoma grayi]